MRFTTPLTKSLILVFLGILNACGGPNTTQLQPSEEKPGDPSATERQDLSTTASSQNVALALSPRNEDALIADLQSLHETFSPPQLKNPYISPQVSFSSKQSKFEDVKQWHQLSNHYAAGYDTQGKLIAIYDLSYQNVSSLPFIARSLLGTIGIADLNLAAAFRLIRKALNDQKALPQPSFQQEHEQAFNHVLAANHTKILSTLDYLEEHHAQSKPTIEPNWWTRVKWNRADLQALDTEPLAFKLSDINFASLVDERKNKEFAKKSQELSKIFAETFGLESSFDLLDLFEFVRHEQGSYNVYLSATGSALLGMHANQPMKIIDLLHPDASLASAFLRGFFQKVLQQLVGLIPEPTVATLLKYAVGRWFDLYKQQQSLHRYRALEYINLAQKGSLNSPFAMLTEEEREKAAMHILSHETNAIDLIFNRPSVDKWLLSFNKETSMVEANKLWANEQNYVLSPVGPLYYFAHKKDDPTDGHLLAFGGRRFLSKGPFPAVNYSHPHQERVHRNLLKAVAALIQVVNIPVPLANMVLQQLYDFLIMQNVRAAEMWDARLVSYLHLLQEQAAARDFRYELNLLYEQRVNPFELDLEEEAKHVSKAREFIGLPGNE